MSHVTLVVAVAENGAIGKDGALPWRIPEDLRRFKALTMGRPVIMGRKTWDSLPKKPLAGRRNIVVTRNAEFHAEGAVVAHSFSDALAIAQSENPDSVMVIGGAEIFAAALPLARRIELTEIAASPAGDAFMPPIDRAEWREATRTASSSAEGLNYSFVTLERR